ncbi:hypothetical protein SCALM49S_02946 [Streptomyces californicus]
MSVSSPTSPQNSTWLHTASRNPAATRGCVGIPLLSTS